jgi:hypothetical protein
MTGTLRVLINDNYTLTAHCHECNRAADVDLRAMAERYGMDAPVHGPRLIGRGLLKCSRCGSANCSMRINPNGPGMGRPR